MKQMDDWQYYKYWLIANKLNDRWIIGIEYTVSDKWEKTDI